MGSHKKILLKKVNTYNKNHSGEYFGDSESSKVKRDKMKLIKLNNDAKNRVKRLLPPDMSTIPDEDLDFYEEIQYEGKKARGNANSHNKRYKELSKHDFFQ